MRRVQEKLLGHKKQVWTGEWWEVVKPVRYPNRRRAGGWQSRDRQVVSIDSWTESPFMQIFGNQPGNEKLLRVLYSQQRLVQI